MTSQNPIWASKIFLMASELIPFSQGKKLLSFFVYIILFGTNLFAQGSNQAFTSLSNSGNTNWTVPAGVTQITVACWGGGGAGGGATGNPSAGGGGAGGAYSRRVLTVVPGTVYNVHVGAGGTGGTGAGGNGDNSWLGTSTNVNSALVLAQGGAGGAAATANNTSAGGALGSFSSSIGTIIRKGGNGGTGASGTSSGGGGESGGISDNGNNGGVSNGGAGLFDGGNGGDGGGSNSNGSDGAARDVSGTVNTPGGGGGGGGRANSSTDRSGGDGAKGEVRIYWCSSVPNLPEITSYQDRQNTGDINLTICPGTLVGGGGENDLEIYDNDTWTEGLADGFTYLWEVSLDLGVTWGRQRMAYFLILALEVIKLPELHFTIQMINILFMYISIMWVFINSGLK